MSLWKMSCSGFHLMILQSTRQKYVTESVQSSEMNFEDTLGEDINSIKKKRMNLSERSSYFLHVFI